MNRIILLAAITLLLFSGCASKKVPKPDYQNANEVLKDLDKLKGEKALTEEKPKVKVNTYIVTRPNDVQALRTAPKIMQTLFLGYVDKYDNQVSDYFTNTMIDNGDWLSQKSDNSIENKLGGIND